MFACWSIWYFKKLLVSFMEIALFKIEREADPSDAYE